MANTLGSNNPFPSVLFAEHVDPANPGAGTQRLFVDTDHILKLIDSAGTVTTYTGGAGLSDPMTTRGDIIVRNASNVTARLAVGSSGKVLSSDGTDVSWQTPAGGSAPNCYENVLTAPVTVVNANTFYDFATLTPAAGTYLVYAECDLLSVHSAGTNATIRLRTGSTTHTARNGFLPGPGGNSISLSCSARITVDGSTAIVAAAASVRGSSDGSILDTAASNGTTDKCSRMTALLITSA